MRTSTEDRALPSRPPTRKSSPAGSDSLTTMVEKAYDRLRHQILHGELEPGTIVSERMLSKRLRLGKTPVRSAVQRLASEGLMTVGPRRGIVVSPQSIQDIVDLYEVRLELEQLVVRRIAGHLRPEQLEQLQANLQTHQELAGYPEPAQMLAVDFEFHRLLCTFHGNTHLIAVMERIRDALFPELRLSHLKSPHRVAEAVLEHQAIADAIFAGDADEAELRMARHLSSCQQFVMSRGMWSNNR